MPTPGRKAAMAAGLAIALAAALFAYQRSRLSVDGDGEVARIVERYDPVFTPQRGERAADLSKLGPNDWPGYRGSNRDGVAGPVETAFDGRITRPRRLWRHPSSGGLSGAAATGDFCVIHELRGNDEVVACLELRTGKEAWSHAYSGTFSEEWGGAGPRATPAIAGGKVYALGSLGGLRCLDGATGKLLWKRDIRDGAEHGSTPLFGMVPSPLVAGGRVIVAAGGKGKLLRAYDATSGEPVWSQGDGEASYSSPAFAMLAGAPQILLFHAEGLSGHRASDGAPLWRVPWVSNPPERNNVCQPVPIPATKPGDADGIFLASGYGVGCAFLELRREGEKFAPVMRWRNRNLRAKFSSVVRRGDLVFGFDEQFLVAVDWRTGKRAWRGPGRYGFGQLALAGDLLLVQSEGGEILLGEASTTTFAPTLRFAGLDERIWTPPCLAGNLLVMKNERTTVCYDLAASEPID
jgi:outer membrane protein assembly factor BamB